MSRLIWIYTAILFWLSTEPLFRTIVLTRFKDGRVHFGNPGMKELLISQYPVIVNLTWAEGYKRMATTVSFVEIYANITKYFLQRNITKWLHISILVF